MCSYQLLHTLVVPCSSIYLLSLTLCSVYTSYHTHCHASASVYYWLPLSLTLMPAIIVYHQIIIPLALSPQHGPSLHSHVLFSHVFTVLAARLCLLFPCCTIPGVVPIEPHCPSRTPLVIMLAYSRVACTLLPHTRQYNPGCHTVSLILPLIYTFSCSS